MGDHVISHGATYHMGNHRGNHGRQCPMGKLERLREMHTQNMVAQHAYFPLCFRCVSVICSVGYSVRLVVRFPLDFTIIIYLLQIAFD
jgi:hypothetical protein